MNVNVGENLYNYLLEIQKERREVEGRKTALSEILLELAEQDQINATQNLVQGSAQNFTQNSILNGVQNSVQNSNVVSNLDVHYLEIREQNLLKRMSDLQKWEEELRQKDHELLDLERQNLKQDLTNEFNGFDFE